MSAIGERGLSRAEARDIAARLEAEGFKALGDRVCVVRDPEEETSGGIIIPDQFRERPIRGTVVMVGESVAGDIMVGDRVVYTRYNPTTMELPLLNDERVVLAVLMDTDIYIRWGR